MGEIKEFLERWEMDVPGVRRRMILAPVPRERDRWYALWLLTQGWTAEALERDPHTIGRWLSAFAEGGPTVLIFEQSGGRPPALGEAQQAALQELPAESGIELANWTLQQAQEESCLPVRL